jgi:transcriptional regulator NrdR family protein
MQAFSVTSQDHLEPFSRDKLLLSIHDSLKHRKTATNDASALTSTILSSLRNQLSDAIIPTEQIAQAAYEVLSNFDTAAASHYQAFHMD